MHRAGRQMQVSARFGDDVLVADAECDIAAYHLEGLVPRTAASWGSTAFRAGLAEDFAAAGSGAGGKNRDLLADDIMRAESGRGCDNERFGHERLPCVVLECRRCDFVGNV
jgi:hypothetical protein